MSIEQKNIFVTPLSFQSIFEEFWIRLQARFLCFCSCCRERNTGLDDGMRCLLEVVFIQPLHSSPVHNVCLTHHLNVLNKVYYWDVVAAVEASNLHLNDSYHSHIPKLACFGAIVSRNLSNFTVVLKTESIGEQFTHRFNDAHAGDIQRVFHTVRKSRLGFIPLVLSIYRHDLWWLFTIHITVVTQFRVMNGADSSAHFLAGVIG